MGLNNFEIYFDNSDQATYSGNVITGRVEFNTDSSIKVKVITITFKGVACTSWTEREIYQLNGASNSKSVPYSGAEEYFNVQTYLLGGPNKTATVLQSGLISFPFSYTIPATVPSSYEGKKGYVRYTIKVVLIRPWKFDQILKRTFTVISPLDLNYNPNCRNPASLKLEKGYRSRFIHLGCITCYVKIPHSGFVLGQKIPVTFELENGSSNSIKSIKLRLYQLVTYHSHTPRRHSKKYEVMISGHTVAEVPSSESSFTEHFVVPTVPPSTLSNCGIIDIQYQILVELLFGFCQKNLLGKLPIELGTVPLSDEEPVPITPSGVNVSQFPHFGWCPVVVGSPMYPYPPLPPSYEESQTGALLNRSSREFAPLNSEGRYFPPYPVHNFHPVPSPQDLPNNLPGPSAPPPGPSVPSPGPSTPSQGPLTPSPGK